LAALDERCALPFDLYRQISLDDVQQLLGARMHVPWRGSAGSELDDADHSLLHHLALALEILAQDLRQFRSGRRLRECDIRHGWNDHSQSGKTQEFATDDLHGILLVMPAARRGVLHALLRETNASGLKFPAWLMAQAI